jgi:L-alanine-DL-glutamate epimerase-like enolase superfamily enzyme
VNQPSSASFAAATVVDAGISFSRQRLFAPLQLSSGTIEDLTQAMATVVVDVGGVRAAGRGTVFLSDLWAWPTVAHSHAERDAALRRLCELIAVELPLLVRGEALHPLEFGLRLHELACEHLKISPDPPSLARAMCASPFDAAVHDAAARALQKSAFALYDEAVALPSADRYFPEGGACRAIAELIQPPKRELPAWYVVSKDDNLKSTLVPAIHERGYWCFKLKLMGCDNAFDVARTIEVFRTAQASGVLRPRITVDTNEANLSAESVLEFLDQLETVSAGAFASLEYLEQPTSRDIRAHTFDWRTVARRKPVLLDEGLTDLSLLAVARDQGYSGFALKTCKGHSMLLTAAAWARRQRMIISLQDLTNPGVSLIHAALVGAHLPTVNGAELNSPQFTPAANAEFAARLPELFEPRGGVHHLPQLLPIGLGSGM